MGQNVKINVYFGIFWGPWGVFNYQTEPILLSSYPLTHIYVYVKQGSNLLRILNPKYKNNNTFFIFGGFWGGSLRQTQVNENFRAVRPHHRADICITREKNNHQFFICGPQYTKMCIFGYSGGPGWHINNRIGPILLPSYPLTYINLHIKYGSNPIMIFWVIVRTMKCLRTRIAADAA